jgi:hypothetical protein
LGHQDVVQVPRHFNMQFMTCGLVILSMPPGIDLEVSMVLKATM